MLRFWNHDILRHRESIIDTILLAQVFPGEEALIRPRSCAATFSPREKRGASLETCVNPVAFKNGRIAYSAAHNPSTDGRPSGHPRARCEFRSTQASAFCKTSSPAPGRIASHASVCR